MKPRLNVLVTGAGAPGIQGTLYSLRENYDNRQVNIVGTDIKDSVAGRFLCDCFFTIPPAKDKENYLQALSEICKQQQIDALVPQNTMELFILSEHKEAFRQYGTEILVSGQSSIMVANNKASLFNVAQKCGVPTSLYGVCTRFEELSSLVKKMQSKNGMAVVKPPLSNGSRGVRIVSENRHRKDDFYNEKPNNLYCSLNELYDILGDEFPELMVMQYLPGDEYTVDVFRYNKVFYAIPRKRETIRSGITFTASLEKNNSMIEFSKLLSDACNLTLCYGFQFKMDEDNQPILLESNPRVQGTMVMSTFCGANIIYSSVKAILGEEIPKMKLDWNTQLYRYWGAVSVNSNGIIRI